MRPTTPSFLAPYRLTNVRMTLGRSFDLTCKGFPEERFDVALDKACLDSIICGFNGAWMADRYLQQIDRYVCAVWMPWMQNLTKTTNIYGFYYKKTCLRIFRESFFHWNDITFGFLLENSSGLNSPPLKENQLTRELCSSVPEWTRPWFSSSRVIPGYFVQMELSSAYPTWARKSASSSWSIGI